LAGIRVDAIDSAGIFTATLIGNDYIDPPGTYYVATISDGNGEVLQCNAYRFLGDGIYDIGNTQPINPDVPPQPIPPPLISQLIEVPFSPAPVFDGSVLTAWQIILTGDVTSGHVSGCFPGNLYTFIILQDEVGGHLFTWPDNVSSPSPVNPDPGSRTIQTFIADANANLTPAAPGTYYP
jgi:hypothetical protein